MTHPGARVDLRLVPAAVTAWAVTAAGVVWSVGRPLAVFSLAIGAGWWLAGGLLGRRFPLLAAGAAAVAATAVIGAGFGLAVGLRSDASTQHPLAQRRGATAWVTVTAADAARQAGPGRLMFRANLSQVDDREMSGAVTVFAKSVDFAELTAGQPVRFRARITAPTRRDLTVAVLTAVGRPHFGRPAAVQRAARAVRQAFAATAQQALPADQAAMLPALVLGDTTAVTAGTTDEFRTAGLTHLTAVSGANVTIVCGAVLLSAYLVGPRIAVALAAVALVAFVVVVQPSASVLRAAVMGALALAAVLAGRRRQAIPVLAATVIVLMTVAPQLAVDVGFALSVVATAALILLAPIWSARLVAAGWPKVLADAVCVALAAQLVTAPLIAAVSGRFSMISVLANLIAGVVVPPITVLGTLAAVLVAPWPAAAGLLIRFTGPEVWWLLGVAHAAARVPGAAVPVPSGWGGMLTVALAGGAAVALWRRRWFRLAAAGGLLCAAAWSVSGLVGGP